MEDSQQKNLDDVFQIHFKKGIDYYLQKIKISIFLVLDLLRNNEEEEETGFLFYFTNALDYFQMHQFPFYVTIFYLWKQDAFMESINIAQNLFQISNYIPNLSYESLLVTVYILLFLILLIIVDIMYVSYSFSQQRFRAMWPVIALRHVISLVVTVLFLPITETLTSIIQCAVDPETGEYTIYGYENITIQCWVGWHTFHALVDLAFILLFVLVCGVVAYNFFEPSMTSSDRTARQDSYGEVAFITNKIACQLMYSLLRPNYPEQAWLMVITTFLLSLWLFKIYNFDDPYYDFQVGLFYCICSTYYAWATFMLLVCKILESTTFNGGFVAWLLGVPFIVSIMQLTKKSKIETLIRSQTKFRNGGQIWSHIRYVLQLIENQSKNKNSYVLLVGYIEKHKETCGNDDCPLKVASKKKNRKTQFAEIEEQIKGLILELDKMFVNGLKKFPSSVELRIFYALFLYERRNNQTKALEEFQLSSQYKPALYQQFIIFRYTKEIREGKLSNKKNEGDDKLDKIKLDNNLRICEEMIKYSANLHKEFWIELKEEQPDLGRLMNIGARISKATNYAKYNYFEAYKRNPTDHQIIKVFGTFMVNVLNDHKQGVELLMQARQTKEMLKKNQQAMNEFISYESANEPFIYVGARKSESGVILNMNSIFTALFGYTKDEIIGKRINQLMPHKYAEKHDLYLNAFFENIVINLRDIDSDYLEVDQNRLFKHKNGYIFPLIYKVSFQSNEFRYVAVFRSEASLKTSVYFIVDKNSVIQEMSSGAITFFDLELKSLQEKIKLNEYIPDVLTKNNKDVVSKAVRRDSTMVQFYFNCQVKEISLPFRNKDDSIDEDNRQHQLQMDKTGLYIVKLDKIEKNEANLKYLNKRNQNSGSISSPIPSDSQIKLQSLTNVTSNTQKYPTHNQGNESCIPLKEADLMEIDPNYMIYMQDLYQTPDVEEFKDLFKNAVAETDSVPSIDYTENIVTKRLINGNIVGINEEQEELFLQQLAEEEEENSLFRNQGDLFEDDDEYKLFTYSNSASLISRVLNVHHKHRNITIFKLYSSLWIVFILIMTSLQFYFCEQQFTMYKQDLDILYYVNTQLVDINKITSRVIDICIQSADLYQFNTSTIQQDIFQASERIINFSSFINSVQFLGLNDYYVQDVPFRFYNDVDDYNVSKISLESAILLVSSLALNASIHQDASQINSLDTYAQGVIQNYFNVINLPIINISEDLYESISDFFDNPQLDLLILLAVSIFVSLLAMIKFIFLMFDIKTQRENVLFLFLDIPAFHVENLYKKCDKFLKTYISFDELKNKNVQEGFDSSEDEEEPHAQLKLEVKQTNDDGDDSIFKQSLTRKKIINKYRENRLKGNQGIIAQFFIISVFTLIFTVYNILSSQTEQSKINFIIPQYYKSTYNIYRYAYYLNMQKLMMLNHTITISNNSLSDLVLSELRLFTGNALNLNQFNYELLSRLSDLRDKYINTYYGNICVERADAEQCESKINGHLTLGVFNVESYYLDYFRQSIVEFNENLMFNSPLLGKKELHELDESLYNYVFEAIKDLVELEKQNLTSDMNATQQIQMILLIVFIIILIAIFLFVWLPFLESLNTQQNQTIQMINMIPLEVIKINRSLRKFVKDLIKTTKLH